MVAVGEMKRLLDQTMERWNEADRRLLVRLRDEIDHDVVLQGSQRGVDVDVMLWDEKEEESRQIRRNSRRERNGRGWPIDDGCIFICLNDLDAVALMPWACYIKK